MKPLEGQMVIPDETYLRPDLFVADTVYMPHVTKLLETADKVGCKWINGDGMMLYQGAEAFKLFTGKEMPIEHMKEFLNIK
ncbi:shikimate 5-dehydrogenase [Clostridium beijerinckii]|nr:shikimate 5-dehydrogenase [Clostridium beijerinckii]NRZ51723.1 shikimate 5-dehydrogenase [Clostridium beijerinckii]